MAKSLIYAIDRQLLRFRQASVFPFILISPIFEDGKKNQNAGKMPTSVSSICYLRFPFLFCFFTWRRKTPNHRVLPLPVVAPRFLVGTHRRFGLVTGVLPHIIPYLEASRQHTLAIKEGGGTLLSATRPPRALGAPPAAQVPCTVRCLCRGNPARTPPRTPPFFTVPIDETFSKKFFLAQPKYPLPLKKGAAWHGMDARFFPWLDIVIFTSGGIRVLHCHLCLLRFILQIRPQSFSVNCESTSKTFITVRIERLG